MQTNAMVIGRTYRINLYDGDVIAGEFLQVKRTTRGSDYLFGDDSFSLGVVGIRAEDIANVEQIGR